MTSSTGMGNSQLRSSQTGDDNDLSGAKRHLINELDDFLIGPFANISDISYTLNITEVRLLPVERVLAQGGLTLVNELSANEWYGLQARVTSKLNSRDSEVDGVDACMLEILTACNNSGNYDLAFENDCVELDPFPERPEVLVTMPLHVGGGIDEVVIPVALNKFGDLSAAIDQGLRHLISKLRDLVEIRGFRVPLSGFCVGSNGVHLAVGHAIIRDAKLTVAYSGLDKNVLWCPAGKKYKRIM